MAIRVDNAVQNGSNNMIADVEKASVPLPVCASTAYKPKPKQANPICSHVHFNERLHGACGRLTRGAINGMWL